MDRPAPGTISVTERTRFGARTVLALLLGIPLISIWAIQRDNGGCPGTIDSNSCSGLHQPRWAVSHLLES